MITALCITLACSLGANFLLSKRLYKAMKYNEGLFTTALEAITERDALKARKNG